MLPGIKQFNLTGKTAIVTGGSKGLGQAMAEGLASAGANLLLTSRNIEEAQAVAEQIKRDCFCRTGTLARRGANGMKRGAGQECPSYDYIPRHAERSG